MNLTNKKMLAGPSLDNATSLKIMVHPFDAGSLDFAFVYGRAKESLTSDRGVFATMTVTALTSDRSPRESHPLRGVLRCKSRHHCNTG